MGTVQTARTYDNACQISPFRTSDFPSFYYQFFPFKFPWNFICFLVFCNSSVQYKPYYQLRTVMAASCAEDGCLHTFPVYFPYFTYFPSRRNVKQGSRVLLLYLFVQENPLFQFSLSCPKINQSWSSTGIVCCQVWFRCGLGAEGLKPCLVSCFSNSVKQGHRQEQLRTQANTLSLKGSEVDSETQ